MTTPDREDLWGQILLDGSDQLSLAAGYLWLMNRALEVTSSPGRVSVRDEFRDQLRAGPLGAAAATGPLGIESKSALEDLLAGSKSLPRCLAMLVELCACEPFAEQDFVIPHWVKEGAVSDVAVAMGAEVDEDDVEASFIALREGQSKSQSRALVWLLVGAGTVAGIAVAGLAAPAIGAAIGGAMGLSGAAATSAGLAWLGGGAVAAGGYGMAGGVSALVTAGGLLGAGVGAAGGDLLASDRGSGEAVKLFATCLCLDRRILEDGPGAAQLLELRRWIRQQMFESSAEIEKRANASADAEQAEHLAETGRIMGRLGEALGAEPRWKP